MLCMPCMHANLAFINSLMPFMKGLLKRVRLAAGSARGCASRLCLGTPSASGSFQTPGRQASASAQATTATCTTPAATRPSARRRSHFSSPGRPTRARPCCIDTARMCVRGLLRDRIAACGVCETMWVHCIQRYGHAPVEPDTAGHRSEAYLPASLTGRRPAMLDQHRVRD